MRTVDLIARKRDGEELSEAAIGFLVRGFTRGEIPDYQMAAFLMAVVQRDMSRGETVAMTRAMIESGDLIGFPQIGRYKVDKHSTGGVGDKVTLVLAPVLASLGIAVPKLSGRGLGHTGGTLDKLESIRGFRTALEPEEFTRIANEVGVAVAGATHTIVPADQKMYALRDVTATVESIPLIVASIVGKKLAVKTDALVIDVKVGDGAFFRAQDQADRFSELAVATAADLGRNLATVQTAMEQPLGHLIGNALEVKEAIATLRGEGPEDLVEVVLALAARLLAARDGSNLEVARQSAREALDRGDAWEVFMRWVEAQGGDLRVIEDPRRLPSARRQIEVQSTGAGTVRAIRARAIGELAMELGAGRATKDDEIDPAAGVALVVKVGGRIGPGETVAVLHTNRDGDATHLREKFLKALELTEREFAPSPVVIRP